MIPILPMANKFFTSGILKPICSRLFLYGFGAATSCVLLMLYLWAIQEQDPARVWPHDAFSDWGRDLLGAGERVATFDRSFSLTEFAYINGELYAAGDYKNIDPQYGICVHGIVTPDGRFWPKFRLLASNDRQKWKTVGRAPAKKGEATQKVLIPDEALPVYVDLEVYKTLILKYRYGRIVTEAGRELDFELKDLTPPSIDFSAREAAEKSSPLIYRRTIEIPARRED
jgi:hypothetical protein